MRRQPFRRAHLIRPIKTTRAVSCELNVVRRICINKILGFNLQSGDIGTGKSPIANDCAQRRKTGRVVDRLVTPERGIERAAFIEAAKSVKAGPIQIIKKLRGFYGLKISRAYKIVEAIAVAIKKLLVIAHLNPDFETALHLNIKINQVRIEIVQDC